MTESAAQDPTTTTVDIDENLDRCQGCDQRANRLTAVRIEGTRVLYLCRSCKIARAD